MIFRPIPIQIGHGVTITPCGEPPEIGGLPAQGAPRYYSTEDLDDLPIFYSGQIQDMPVVTKTLVDPLWGPVAIEDIQFTLAMTPELLTGYQLGMRGQMITLDRYDRLTGYLARRWHGIVAQVRRKRGQLLISGHNMDRSGLEQPLPRGVITTAEFPQAVDIGATLTVVLGNVAQVPLRIICDDPINSRFDYLVARGTVGVPFVFRQSPDGRRVDVDPSEYIVSTSLYPCYTVLRFARRQTDFGDSGFVPVWADVVGFQSERNFARAIRTMLSDTVWGLGVTVDAITFDLAETQLAAIGDTTSGLFCDGAMTTQDQAQNWLIELCQVRGMRLYLTDEGAIGIKVDIPQTTPRMVIQDGTEDGERNLVDITEEEVDINDAIRNIDLAYRQDVSRSDAFYFFHKRRVVNTEVGADKPYTNRFIRDHYTADRVGDYVSKRLAAAQKSVQLMLPQAARDLHEGDLVRVIYALLGIDGIYEISQLKDRLTKLEAIARGWTADAYVYTQGEIPVESTGGGGKIGGPPPVAPPGTPPPTTPPGTPGPPPPQSPGAPPLDWGSSGTLPFYSGGHGGVIGSLRITVGGIPVIDGIGVAFGGTEPRTIVAGTSITIRISDNGAFNGRPPGQNLNPSFPLKAGPTVPGGIGSATRELRRGIRIWTDSVGAGYLVAQNHGAVATHPNDSVYLRDDGHGHLLAFDSINATSLGSGTISYTTGLATFTLTVDVKTPIAGHAVQSGSNTTQGNPEPLPPPEAVP